MCNPKPIKVLRCIKVKTNLICVRAHLPSCVCVRAHLSVCVWVCIRCVSNPALAKGADGLCSVDVGWRITCISST